MFIPKSEISVFTDFDGTISLDDIGDKLFQDFGVFEPYNSKLKAGLISIREYWHILCESLDRSISLQDIRTYAEKFEIDSNFQKFADYCSEKKINLIVVSDGFDVYIDALLKKNGLEHLMFYSNKLIKDKDGAFKPVFTGASESCSCLSASCKRNKMLTHTGSDEIVVYIGDGYSDFCIAEHSDVIFAKKYLAKYCQTNRIPHHHFKTFFDVKYVLEGKIRENKLRKRHQALLKREKAFINE